MPIRATSIRAALRVAPPACAVAVRAASKDSAPVASAGVVSPRFVSSCRIVSLFCSEIPASRFGGGRVERFSRVVRTRPASNALAVSSRTIPLAICGREGSADDGSAFPASCPALAKFDGYCGPLTETRKLEEEEEEEEEEEDTTAVPVGALAGCANPGRVVGKAATTATGRTGLEGIGATRTGETWPAPGMLAEVSRVLDPGRRGCDAPACTLRRKDSANDIE